MSFISYAQNFEDVMLWRALKNVQSGFYIDVGAAWPDEHSVTKLFYDKGWSGINVEPNPKFHAKLSQQRKRDINLPLAVGKENSQATINIIEDTGLSTLQHDIASSHQSHGWKTSAIPVEIQTLSHIWQQHVANDQIVHFLKIDVEGFELDVIQGNNWIKNRPWIVLVEATLPSSQEESYQSWEKILLEYDYEFTYADGLNRFYIANEHNELTSFFRYPPNVFDGFTLAQQHTFEHRATQAENRATQAENRATQAENRATQAEAKAIQTGQQLQSLLVSKSWRITAPLRWLGKILRSLTRNSLKSRLKILLQYTVRYINQRSKLKRIVLSALNKTPRLKAYLARITIAAKATPWLPPQHIPTDLAQLPPRTRQIYQNLETAIKQNK